MSGWKNVAYHEKEQNCNKNVIASQRHHLFKIGPKPRAKCPDFFLGSQVLDFKLFAQILKDKMTLDTAITKLHNKWPMLQPCTVQDLSDRMTNAGLCNPECICTAKGCEEE